MSKFADDIQARLIEISKLIPTATITERRSLQKERADLEGKLRKVLS